MNFWRNFSCSLLKTWDFRYSRLSNLLLVNHLKSFIFPFVGLFPFPYPYSFPWSFQHISLVWHDLLQWSHHNFSLSSFFLLKFHWLLTSALSHFNVEPSLIRFYFVIITINQLFSLLFLMPSKLLLLME